MLLRALLTLARVARHQQKIDDKWGVDKKRSLSFSQIFLTERNHKSVNAYITLTKAKVSAEFFKRSKIRNHNRIPLLAFLSPRSLRSASSVSNREKGVEAWWKGLRQSWVPHDWDTTLTKCVLISFQYLLKRVTKPAIMMYYVVSIYLIGLTIQIVSPYIKCLFELKMIHSYL